MYHTQRETCTTHNDLENLQFFLLAIVLASTSSTSSYSVTISRIHHDHDSILIYLFHDSED